MNNMNEKIKFNKSSETLLSLKRIIYHEGIKCGYCFTFIVNAHTYNTVRFPAAKTKENYYRKLSQSYKQMPPILNHNLPSIKSMIYCGNTGKFPDNAEKTRVSTAPFQFRRRRRGFFMENSVLVHGLRFRIFSISVQREICDLLLVDISLGANLRRVRAYCAINMQVLRSV